jgi:hypothetical protein
VVVRQATKGMIVEWRHNRTMGIVHVEVFRFQYYQAGSSLR